MGEETITVGERGVNCPEKPEKLLGQPLGQYHCPCCGMMIVAGLPHPDPDEDNPDFILLEQLEGPFPTAEEADAYLRGEGVIKKCEVCGQDATLTNNFVTYLTKRHSEVAAERDSLRARCNALEVALRAFVDYYDQAGIGDALETDDDEGLFDGDEKFNVRQGREALAEGESRVPDSEEKNLGG